MNRQKINCLVVKFGTEVLLGKSTATKGNLDPHIFRDAGKQIVKLQNRGVKVVLISSGAIKAGRERTKQLGTDTSHFDKKDFAGVGTRPLLNMWGDAFDRYEREVAPLWLTYANWKHKRERKSFESSIFNYLQTNIVPLINENDVVSDQEIEFMERGISENDRLARMVALLIKADAILFLTNVGGVYEDNPRKNPDARLYETIDVKMIQKLRRVSSGQSSNGTGGMKAKLTEAARCFKAGMRVAIAGMEENTIADFGIGKPVGTSLGFNVRLK